MEIDNARAVCLGIGQMRFCAQPAAEPRASRWTHPELAQIIRRYWGHRGHMPDVRVEQMDVMLGADGVARQLPVIRSDMVNGRPVDYEAKRKSVEVRFEKTLERLAE